MEETVPRRYYVFQIEGLTEKVSHYYWATDERGWLYIVPEMGPPSLRELATQLVQQTAILKPFEHFRISFTPPYDFLPLSHPQTNRKHFSRVEKISCAEQDSFMSSFREAYLLEELKDQET